MEASSEKEKHRKACRCDRRRHSGSQCLRSSGILTFFDHRVSWIDERPSTSPSNPGTSSTTDPTKKFPSTTTTAGTGGAKSSLDAAETSQINDELTQLQSLLNDTSADFVAGQKDN